MKRFLRTFVEDTKGLITVEFLCTLPIILAALVFVYEFGRAFWAYEVVSQDMRSALRYLSRADSVDFTNTSDPSILDAENLAKTGQTTGGTVHYPWTSSSTIAVNTTAFSDTYYNANGSVITMTANVPITLSFLAFIGAKTGYTMTVSDTAQYIGD